MTFSAAQHPKKYLPSQASKVMAWREIRAWNKGEETGKDMSPVKNVYKLTLNDFFMNCNRNTVCTVMMTDHKLQKMTVNRPTFIGWSKASLALNESTKFQTILFPIRGIPEEYHVFNTILHVNIYIYIHRFSQTAWPSLWLIDFDAPAKSMNSSYDFPTKDGLTHFGGTKLVEQRSYIYIYIYMGVVRNSSRNGHS